MDFFITIFSLSIVLVLLYYFVRWLKYKTLSPLLSKKHNFGKRRDTFRCVINWMAQNNAKVLVETGVARMGLAHAKSDGASTIVFGTWAKQANNGAKLYSVDISEDNVATCNKTVDAQGLTDYVDLNVSDSVAYLRNFTKDIDMLYLDSYDYDKRDQEIIKASQEHHLHEIQAVESRLHDKTIILIDDCDLPGGGKGKLVIDYLKDKGWKVLMSKYQVVMVRSE